MGYKWDIKASDFVKENLYESRKKERTYYVYFYINDRKAYIKTNTSSRIETTDNIDKKLLMTLEDAVNVQKELENLLTTVIISQK